MQLPKFTPKDQQERVGVGKVSTKLAELGLIFKETLNTDVGIDGQIEYVNNIGEATGKIVAVQIKSGDSYLYKSKTDIDNWTFYPEEKHKHYWEQYPIPVILLIYSPIHNKIYFIDARYHLKVYGMIYFKIPKTNVLCEETKKLLFETVGNFDEPFYEIEKVFDIMVSNRTKNNSFNISFLDLFILGLTNTCRQIFFDMSIAMDIAECRSQFVSMGNNEYDFLNSYIRFIVSQNLAEVDFGDCLIEWNKPRCLVPRFLAPLTWRGKELLDYINNIETKHSTIMPETHLVQERLIELVFDEYSYTRIEKSKKIQEQHRLDLISS
jgi:hypothetical protein